MIDGGLNDILVKLRIVEEDMITFMIILEDVLKSSE